MQIVKEYIIENKKKLLVLLLLLVLAIVLSFLVREKYNNKLYPSSPFVYTKETYNHDEYLTSSLPYINVKGKAVSEINAFLLKRYYEITAIDKSTMVYNSYRNGDIISLVVKVYNQEEFGIYPEEVYFYNVDVKKGKVLSDEELLNRFNVSSEEVLNAISAGIREYYDYEASKGYLNYSDCDFTCYLSNTNSLPLEDAHYYVKDGYLMAYKEMYVNSIFFYDKEAEFDLFKFEIKKIK